MDKKIDLRQAKRPKLFEWCLTDEFCSRVEVHVVSGLKAERYEAVSARIWASMLCTLAYGSRKEQAGDGYLVAREGE